jgi:hypothetical protein
MISLEKIKDWLTVVNSKWITWIAAISITIALNLMIVNLTSLINQYRQNNTRQQTAAAKLVYSLDSINNQLSRSLDEVRSNVYINYEGIQKELVSIKLQLLIQNKKIEIISGHITGYEDMIRGEFIELDRTLKQFMKVNRDSLTIKYFKR